MARDTQSVDFLQSWYRSQCDGEWEKTRGVTIESMETPGWMVTVDLSGTGLAGAPMKPLRIDHAAGDWIECRVENGQFVGMGDPAKLLTILQVFEKWVDRSQRIE